MNALPTNVSMEAAPHMSAASPPSVSPNPPDNSIPVAPPIPPSATSPNTNANESARSAQPAEDPAPESQGPGAPITPAEPSAAPASEPSMQGSVPAGGPSQPAGTGGSSLDRSLPAAGQSAAQAMLHHNQSSMAAGFMNQGSFEKKGGTKRPFEADAAQALQEGAFKAVSNKAPRMGGPPPAPGAPAAPPAPVTSSGGGAAPQPAGHIDKDLKNAALRYLNKVKSRFEHQKDVYNDFLDIMKEFQSRQLDTPGVIKKVSTLFMGEAELILGFNDFLPDGYKITERDIAMHYPVKPVPPKPKPKPAAPRNPVNLKTPPELRYAQSYVSKIRKRFRNDREVYKKFLKLLQNYQEDQKSVKEVHDRVKDLFKGHPDLLIEFKQFLPDPPDPTADGGGNTANRSRKQQPASKKQRTEQNRDDKALSDLKYKDEMEFFAQFKARMAPQQWDDFLKLVNLFNNHILTAMELMLVLRDLFTKPTRVPNRQSSRSRPEEAPLELPDLHNSLHKFVQMLCGGYVSVFEGKKAAPKGLHRPNQATPAGPSYMCRPQTTLPICASRDDLCNAVLNDQYSLNPLGSEQTAVLTNTHEMLLFKAEDERFELEMMIDKIEWSINKLEPIAEELSTLSRTEKQRYEIYDRLNVVVMRTIQRLYGEHGHEALDWFYDCPGAAVPVVLARLKQRCGELKSIQHDQHKVWVDVYEKNYHKALDHRSYAFKTHDKKALHTKAIIQTIKDAPQVHVYAHSRPLEDIGLWFVLKEVVKDIVGNQEDADKVIDFWDNWLCPHLFPPKKEKNAPASKTRGQQKEGPKDKWMVYGNQYLVSVVSLHQLLHSRMSEAKQMAADELEPQKGIDVMGQPITPREPGEPVTDLTASFVCATPKRQVGDPFQAFLSILLAMLRQHVDVPKYEDECRTLLGTYSYKLFTLDKLIPRFVKESNTLVQSDHWQAMKKGAAKVEGGTIPPSELKSTMLELFWHNCFELDYTISAYSMKITPVPLKEDENIPALALVSDILAAGKDEEADDKESGDDNDESEEKSKTRQDGDEPAEGLDAFAMEDDDEILEENEEDDVADQDQAEKDEEVVDDKEDQQDDKWRASLLSAQAEAMEEEDDDDE